MCPLCQRKSTHQCKCTRIEDVERSILHCSIYYVSFFDDAPGSALIAALAALMRSIGLKPSDVKVDPILLACAISHNLIDPSLPHE